VQAAAEKDKRARENRSKRRSRRRGRRRRWRRRRRELGGMLNELCVHIPQLTAAVGHLQTHSHVH